MEEWRKLEEEFLLDACMKQNCKDESQDKDLFEKVTFKENEIREVSEH